MQINSRTRDAEGGIDRGNTRWKIKLTSAARPLPTLRRPETNGWETVPRKSLVASLNGARVLAQPMCGLLI